VIPRRGLKGVIATQLDLFEREQHGLLEACAAAERAYEAAPRDEAEERYGDYADLLDEAADVLAEMREAYARALDDEAAEAYAAGFDRAVRRRFPRLARPPG
jgi:hypothetical protein